jgi:hypothetical protein
MDKNVQSQVLAQILGQPSGRPTMAEAGVTPADKGSAEMPDLDMLLKLSGSEIVYELTGGDATPEEAARYDSLPDEAKIQVINNLWGADLRQDPFEGVEPSADDQVNRQNSAMMNNMPDAGRIHALARDGEPIPEDVWQIAEKIYLEQYGEEEGFGGDASMEKVEDIALSLMGTPRRTSPEKGGVEDDILKQMLGGMKPNESQLNTPRAMQSYGKQMDDPKAMILQQMLDGMK